MPIFEYQCTSCESTYDVYHKVKEIKEDVVCPACGSATHKRLMSATQVSMGSSGGYVPASSCEQGGGCCGGSCGIN